MKAPPRMETLLRSPWLLCRVSIRCKCSNSNKLQPSQLPHNIMRQQSPLLVRPRDSRTWTRRTLLRLTRPLQRLMLLTTLATITLLGMTTHKRGLLRRRVLLITVSIIICTPTATSTCLLRLPQLLLVQQLLLLQQRRHRLQHRVLLGPRLPRSELIARLRHHQPLQRLLPLALRRTLSLLARTIPTTQLPPPISKPPAWRLRPTQRSMLTLSSKQHRLQPLPPHQNLL